MSQSESALQSEIRLAIGSLPNARMFRNQSVMAWAGKLIKRYPDGSVHIANAYPIHAGLCVGSGDLIGFKTIIAGSGERTAQFVSCEVKAAKGQPTPEQLNWQRVVQEAGGIAGIVRSVDEAVALFSP